MRTVPLSSALAGMMLFAVPALSAPKVTTAELNGSSSRLMMSCIATNMCAATSVESTAVCG